MEYRQPDHRDYSGLQVIESGSGLEAVTPRPGLSQNRTWEQESALPEAVQPPPPPNNPYKTHNQGYYGYAGAGQTPSTLSSNPATDYTPFAHQQWREKPPDGTICGLRKQVFWAVLAIGIFAIVAAIAVGVGVGIATRNSGDDSAPSTTSAPTATAAGALPAAATNATFSPGLAIICPRANRTLYTLQSQPTRKFLLLCGRDYSSEDGAVDMFTANTTTMAQCLDICSAEEGCTAVGWGNYYGTNTCWLKSSIGEPNWSGDWYAAVEDDSA